MQSVISIRQLTKTYASGHPALKSIDLDIRRGEIFALLGPNGAGKTTLISIICGIVNPGSGQELVYSFDAQQEHTGIAELLRRLAEHDIDFKDLQTQQSSLEEIFVSLVHDVSGARA